MYTVTDLLDVNGIGFVRYIMYWSS